MTERWKIRCASAVADRLEKGAKGYGDRSFDEPIDHLTTMILEEAIDEVAWLFVLWVRVRSEEGVDELSDGREAAQIRFLDKVMAADANRSTGKRPMSECVVTIASCQMHNWHMLTFNLQDMTTRLAKQVAKAKDAK